MPTDDAHLSRQHFFSPAIIRLYSVNSAFSSRSTSLSFALYARSLAAFKPLYLTLNVQGFNPVPFQNQTSQEWTVAQGYTRAGPASQPSR